MTNEQITEAAYEAMREVQRLSGAPVADSWSTIVASEHPIHVAIAAGHRSLAELARRSDTQPRDVHAALAAHLALVGVVVPSWDQTPETDRVSLGCLLAFHRFALSMES